MAAGCPSAPCAVCYNTRPSCFLKISTRPGPTSSPLGCVAAADPARQLGAGQPTHPQAWAHKSCCTLACHCCRRLFLTLTVLHQPELPCVACGFVCPSVGCKGTRALPDIHTYPHGMYKTRRNCGGAGSAAPARGTESRHTGHTEQYVKHRRREHPRFQPCAYEARAVGHKADRARSTGSTLHHEHG